MEKYPFVSVLVLTVNSEPLSKKDIVAPFTGFPSAIKYPERGILAAEPAEKRYVVFAGSSSVKTD